MIGVNEVFPHFKLTGVVGNEIIDIDSAEGFNGVWKVIYFYPKDFTFICPTEIIGMDAINGEAAVFGISGDNEHCKLAWKREHEGLSTIDHILLADCGLKLSSEVGVVDKDAGVCLRATFILDDKNVVKHISCNELDTGRSSEEVLRTLKALKAGGLTGCEWKSGDDFVG
jgi:peroxiredoxin (alkyl hydroperoxide reductase subunit C)